MARTRPKRRRKAGNPRKARKITSTEIALVNGIWLVGLGIVAVLSLQPWMNVASSVVEAISVVPFYDTLAAIPYVSRVVTFLDNIGDNFFSSIVGVVIAVAINYAQVQGGTKASLKQWIVRVIGGLMELAICIHFHAPYQGGIEAMMLDFPQLDAYMVDVPALFMTIANVILFETLFIMGQDYIKELRFQAKQQVQDNERDNSTDNQPAAA